MDDEEFKAALDCLTSDLVKCQSAARQRGLNALADALTVALVAAVKYEIGEE